jgi:hypothetical protein
MLSFLIYLKCLVSGIERKNVFLGNLVEQRSELNAWPVLRFNLGRRSSQAEMVELVMALFDDLVFVNPDVEGAGQDIDMRT